MENQNTSLLNSLLIITCAGKGQGSGHLLKAEKLFEKINLPVKEIVLLNSEQKINNYKFFRSLSKIYCYIKKQSFDIIILDKRETSAGFIKKLKKESIVIIFDSAGIETKFADLVINAIPGLEEVPFQANFQGIAYLPEKLCMKSSRTSPENNTFRIAVSFGNEDYAGLAFYVVKNISSILKNLNLQIISDSKIKIDIISGYLNKNNLNFKKELSATAIEIGTKRVAIEFKVHSQINDLYNKLLQYQLLMTSFGLTAFEAAQQNTPFLLFNPSSYHNALSEKYFSENNCGTKTKKKLIPEYQFLINKKYDFGIMGSGFNKLTSLINNLSLNDFQKQCPQCGSEKILIEKRTKFSNMYFCKSCSLFLLKKFSQDTQFSYKKDYFLTEYKDQYGKTYEEDRQNIYRMSEKRLEIIKKYKKNGNLLDIGSALGFFLDKAAGSGFNADGAEISKYAADYSTKNGHHIYNSGFLSTDFNKKYDIITMWYSIEHFPDIYAVMDKINAIIAKDGLLCISTPNGSGFSARFNSKAFINSYPDDHYYTFSADNLTKILVKYDYKEIFHQNTGIHSSRVGDRFPVIPKFLLRGMYPAVAKLFDLGDTFWAIYKKNNPNP